MQLPPSTAKIVAYIVLGWPVTQEWVDWAVEMLEAAYDTEELRMLAGDYEPLDSDWVKRIAIKIFNDLQIEYKDVQRAISRYVFYLISTTDDNAFSRRKTMDELYQLAYTNMHFEALQGFFALECDLDVLEYVWPGESAADKKTEDEMIRDYFAEWVRGYENR